MKKCLLFVVVVLLFALPLSATASVVAPSHHWYGDTSPMCVPMHTVYLPLATAGSRDSSIHHEAAPEPVAAATITTDAPTQVPTTPAPVAPPPPYQQQQASGNGPANHGTADPITNQNGRGK